MQVALAALLRRYALAQLAVVLTTYQPSSQDDANATLGNAVSLFDAEITTAGDAGDDDSYESLRSLRQSVVADLVARGDDRDVQVSGSASVARPCEPDLSRSHARGATRAAGCAETSRIHAHDISGAC
jgi:prophage DNA circulation protein